MVAAGGDAMAIDAATRESLELTATTAGQRRGSLLDAVRQTDAVFLGVVAAARAGIEAGELAELRMSPPLVAGARFAYVRLAGRTEAPVMQVLRRFVDERLRD